MNGGIAENNKLYLSNHGTGNAAAHNEEGKDVLISFYRDPFIALTSTAIGSLGDSSGLLMQ